MTAKQYLQSYKKMERRYNAIIEEIRAIEYEMISLGSPSFEERVQSCPKKDPIGDIVCNLEKEKGRLALKMAEYRSKMIVIKNQVTEMDTIENDFYVVLFFRYILCKDWKFICESLHLSRAQANVIHGRALLEFDVKFNGYYAEK